MKLIFLILLLTGCSHSAIMKNCLKVENDDSKYVCKTIKPWE